MSRKILTLLVLAATLSFGAVAQADTILYSDPVAWLARSTNLTQVNLNALAQPGGAWNIGQSFTQNGVTFSANNVNGEAIVDPAFNPAYYTDWGTGDAILQVNWGDLNIALPGATSASFYLNSVVPFGDTFLILLNGNSLVLSSNSVSTGLYPNPTFVGLTSDIPISSIQLISQGNAVILLQGFQYGDDPVPATETPVTAPVPEPASLLLFGTGLVGVAASVRRKFRAG
jgi:hypothetical protein